MMMIITLKSCTRKIVVLYIYMHVYVYIQNIISIIAHLSRDIDVAVLDEYITPCNFWLKTKQSIVIYDKFYNIRT